MKNPNAVALTTIIYFMFVTTGIAQSVENDSVRFNYKKIYALCLDANIRPVLELIKTTSPAKLSFEDEFFKKQFEARFSYIADSSEYLNEHLSNLDGLLKIFHEYWRSSLLDSGHKYEQQLIVNLNTFLGVNHLISAGRMIPPDSLGPYLKSYIKGRGWYSGDFGKVGRLYDLHVWKHQSDTTYTFMLHHDKTSSRTVMMKDFLTLGWEEYATLGKYYPGGWTTADALYCVQKAYDITSENFLISYLAHESRHFADLKAYPRLSGYDLEYRAKLTELSLAKKTLLKLVIFFMNNANMNSLNEHSVADYRVISDLSKALFKKNFVSEVARWESVSIKRVNKAAYKLLNQNTKTLSH